MEVVIREVSFVVIREVSLHSHCHSTSYIPSYYYYIKQILFIPEENVHYKANDGKCNSQAGQDSVDDKEGQIDVDKPLILGNSNWN